jgi:hypothetical protein
MFQTEQRNLNEKHLNLLFCDPRCLVLQAIQKSNGVCVHTKPTSNPCSSRSVWKPCLNCYGEHLNLLFCDPRCLILQAVQKSNGVCVHTKPTSNPCSSRSVWKPCLNWYGEHLNLLFCDPRCLVLQAVQKSNGVTYVKLLWRKWRFQTISLRHSVNATAYCDVSAPFSNHSSVV